jgi:hypothetical protein
MPEFVFELPPLVAESVTPAAEVTGMAISHADAAVDRLALQFRKPKIIAFVRALCGPMQALEQAFVDLITLRNLDDATGVTLEMLAKLVGQKLIPDIDEDTLRSYTRARVRANKSSGLGDQILRIARLVLTDYANRPEVAAEGTLGLRAFNFGHASYVLEVRNVDLPWDLAELLFESFLLYATGAGIRPLLYFVAQQDDEFDHHVGAFRFGSVTDPTAGVGGFGSVTDATAGGVMAAAIGE